MLPSASVVAELLALAATTFVAATILPFSSELALAAAVKAGTAPLGLLLAFATLGNVGGSCFNYWLGMHARRFEDRRWFPFDKQGLERASSRFNRYGAASLLLAWVPVIGDPLTFVAGALRTRFPLFLALVTAGKLARYVLLAIVLAPE